MVQRFISRWHQEIYDRQGFELQRQLEQDECDAQIVERLDQVIGESGKIAETSCKTRRPQFYSRTLVQHRLKVSILRGHLQSLRLGVDRTAVLHQKIARAGMELHLPSTIRSTKDTLRQACVDLQKLCRDHAEERQKELHDRVAEAASRGNKTKAQILNSILRHETNQKTYKILQKMKNNANSTTHLDRIEIPASWPLPHQQIHDIAQLEDPKFCTEWQLITNPNDVEYYLLLRNRLHFGQAEGTPFTRSPLSDTVDWSASTAEADNILHGAYTHTTTTPHCDELLRACTRATDLDSLPAELTMEEFRGKMKSWKETTSTSPSGRHLGWYKSLFAASITLDTQEQTGNGETIPSQQEAIASLILSVINYCIRHSHVLNRLKKIVNVMIFKEHGNFRIHRLRVIHIYEADFNMLLAVKWRQLLRNADAKDLIHEGQYGGRPGCEAQSLPLLEELKYDLAYLTRRTLLNFDNDATSCYDRIVVPFASLINRKYGLHHKVVTIHAKTLQSAEYHLQTKNRISHGHYSHDASFPIHGTGQGSGNSPCIWLAISSTLFDVHSSLAHGATFISPDGHFTTKMSMVGFVNDSTGTSNDFQPNRELPLSELFRRMQFDAQLWNNLLHCSGGKLELQKCSFHVLRFEFKPNGTPIAALHQYNNKIHITDPETQQSIPIASKRAFEPHKTLGHLKAPSSKLHSELTQLQTKAHRLALLISNSPVTRQGAYLAYTTVYIPSIRYSLPQCYFSQGTLDKAQAASLSKIISKCGFNRNTARALLFAPLDFAGGGFLPWYLLQGEGQTTSFLKHWRTNSLVSKTLRVALSWAQWQAGHEAPILEDVFTPIPYLECRWLKSLRDFLKTINARIIVDHPFTAELERKHDFHIMQYARSCGLFNHHDLAIINYCRLYLHLTTVSELFDSSGTQINQHIFQCRREPWFNATTITTLQQRPSDYQIKMKWQKLCRQWTTSSGQLGASYHFGKWTVPAHKLRRWRQTYIITGKDPRIYSWKDNSFWEYCPDPLVSTVYHPVKPSEWTPTVECTPIDVQMLPNGILHLSPKCSRSTITCPRQRQAPPQTFSQYIRSLLPWEQNLLAGVELHKSPFELMHHLTNLPSTTKLLAVSDGSQQDISITFGWVLGSSCGTLYATHYGNGSGNATSHRAESWGMLSIALFIKHIGRFTQGNDTHPKFQQELIFLSDNSGLISRVNQRLQYSTVYPNATLAPDWDVVEQIYSTVQRLPFSKITVQWVRGHQDAGNSDLSIEAQYNVMADDLARTAIESRPYRENLPVLLPNARCILIIDNRPINGHYSRAVRNQYTLPDYKNYIAKRHQWTSEQQTLVDWELFHRAARTFYHASRVQLTKLVHDKLPTNSELSKTNPLQSEKCHYCESRETFHHLLQCNNPLSAEFRNNLIKDLTEYLHSKLISTRLQNTLLQHVSQSLHVQSPKAGNNSTYGNIDQSSLGSTAILKGFYSIQWRQVLGHQLHDTSDFNLLPCIIKKLWAAQLTFWEAHLKQQNSTPTLTSSTLAAKKQQYQHRIRTLHSKQDQCLPGHRHQYFHPDVEAFLNEATNHQMKQYLHNYEAAINQSIRLSSTTRSIRSLFTFPGFVRRQTTPIPPASTRPPSAPNATNPHATRGNSKHHKHTRWRPPLVPTNTLRQFFPPKPD